MTSAHTAAIRLQGRNPQNLACRLASACLALGLVGASSVALANDAIASPLQLRKAFEAQVELRLSVPDEELKSYLKTLKAALQAVGIDELTPQFIALVDRNPNGQIFLLLWVGAGETPQLIGATPVSTGRPGEYEHFETPTGVFRHQPGNPDYRAEGTRNDNGILGYGEKGARIFDFGWQLGLRGWGPGGISLLRLQMHATDPEWLEPLLGTVRSKGCIRIPAGLNRLLDLYGVLDADYASAAARGAKLPVLAQVGETVPGAGRYLVVVDRAREVPALWELDAQPP